MPKKAYRHWAIEHVLQCVKCNNSLNSEVNDEKHMNKLNREEEKKSGQRYSSAQIKQIKKS